MNNQLIFNIAHYQPMSLIDYPGKRAAVVFLQGCNLNCWYCHNRELIPFVAPENGISYQEILDYLYANQGKVEAVVFTGGEPTCHPDIMNLIYFMDEIKGLGLHNKLDTNGTNPDILKDIISHGVVDYIAMDIKQDPATHFNYYARPKTPLSATMAPIQQSIDLLLNLPDSRGIAVEFRSTLDFVKQNMIELESMVARMHNMLEHGTTTNINYYLQAMNVPEGVYAEEAVPEAEKKKFMRFMKERYSNVKLRI